MLYLLTQNIFSRVARNSVTDNILIVDIHERIFHTWQAMLHAEIPLQVDLIQLRNINTKSYLLSYCLVYPAGSRKPRLARILWRVFRAMWSPGIY